MTSEITNPSRRSVAKGAAWAVPAVAVAATAPSLAASTSYCENPKFAVEVECPPTDLDLLDGNSESLFFTVTNMGDCTVEKGQTFTLDLEGLAGVTVEGLNDINAGAGILFHDTDTGETTKDLAPGESVEIKVFPVANLDVNLQVNGTATLTIAGASASQKYTLVELDALQIASATVAFCGSPADILKDLVNAIGEELAELPAEIKDLLERLIPGGLPKP